MQIAALSRRGPVRRALTTLCAVFAVGFASLLYAPAAQATVMDVVCEGSQTVTYSPPLTNTPQQITTQRNVNLSCTSLLTAISSGNGSSVFPETTSCLLSVTPPNTVSTFTYNWNTGQSSTVTFSSNTVVHAANGTTTVTALGSITSGYGQGALATRVVVSPALSLTACATTGITQQTGITTLTLLI